MNTGDAVKTKTTDTGPAAGVTLTGTITGIIPAGVGPHARYEVTFDEAYAGLGATFDFYAADLVAA